ncbi:DNA-directed RNA polymerase subunit beta [Francisellaceae bacterium CB300]
MSYSYAEKKRIRKEFGVLPHILDVPYLLSIQTESYKKFLHADATNGKAHSGLETVLKQSFPVESKNGQYELHYVGYQVGVPTFDEDECQIRGATYDAPLNVKLRLVVYNKEALPAEKVVEDIREEYVYMGDIPLMTTNGTFIINGTERVVVSQLHRSPGAFFSKDDSEDGAFAARIIPYRGSWLDFEFDSKGIVWARIDRKRKICATVVLKALGLSQEDILAHYTDSKTIKFDSKGFGLKLDNLSEMKGEVLKFDIFDKKDEILVKKNRKLTSRDIKKIKDAGVDTAAIDFDLVSTLRVAKDVINSATGEVIAHANDDVTENLLDACVKTGMLELEVIDFITTEKGRYISDTLKHDLTRNTDEALVEIYKVLRPGDPPAAASVKALFEGLFFMDSRYSLSDIGRMKLNARLGNDKVAKDVYTLENSDIIGVLEELIKIRDGKGKVDDIDHLGNRRVRSVGEMVENQFRVGLYRVEKGIRESMTLVHKEKLMPKDIVNSKPITAAIKEFFTSGALSQFMDQDNPLSEVTHKRRISALGPGGLSRDRAGFEVRDVHATHYGRLCPIETPEGPNIGLINSLASYARVNDYGFLEAPYRKVVNGKVTDNIEYLSAIDEGNFVIAQASTELDDKNHFVEELIQCRSGGEAIFTESSRVQYMDVSAKQMVSAAAALIPFLEHDDANRVLMGANMQRQAVPTLKSEKPMVGTGMEKIVARDSGNCIIARNPGTIAEVDSNRIVIRVNTKKSKNSNLVDIYSLTKFKRSNKNTCINQRPIVNIGDKVEAGDVLADGFATDFGELSLGHNLMVAFMPWNGYNFEDSILLSERIVKDDKYTSIHIEEFTCVARDTKLGPEEITADIPNVSESGLSKLDESGIVHIGANVEAGDILVAKITPKAEQQLTPEERLLRAIFNEKASNVADSSLRMPSSTSGTVINVQVFENDKGGKSQRSLEIEEQLIEKARKDFDEEFGVIESVVKSSIEKDIVGAKISKAKGLKKGAVLTKEFLETLPFAKWLEMSFEDEKLDEKIQKTKEYYDEAKIAVDAKFESKKHSIMQSSELSPGVLQTVKVFVAIKKRIQPGDKMAGRHGNKGVVSRVLPIEDMPYMADGTPVDVCLNPLGIPSRMNIGQILEAHMGLASYGLGKKIERTLEKTKKAADIRKTLEEVYNTVGDKKVDLKALSDSEVVAMAENLTDGVPIATPVFDGAKEEDIKSLLKIGGFASDGQMKLFDGRTGKAFDRAVTVGYMYMLKLDHLVDDKMHARSTGSYSLVTQQPLGGKAQFGGQRFGEMEVWALQAYGAAYTLREMLTVKSDDITGRSKMYKNIVDGKLTMSVDVPESFNVLRNEVRALGIDMDFDHSSEEE